MKKCLWCGGDLASEPISAFCSSACQVMHNEKVEGARPEARRGGARFTVCIDGELQKRGKIRAIKEDRPFGALLEAALRAYLGEKKKRDAVIGHPSRPCIQCGKSFTPRNNHAKLCSYECRRARQKAYTDEYKARKRAKRESERERHPRKPVSCLWCGKEIANPHWARRYCSHECRENKRRQGFKEKRKREGVAPTHKQCGWCGGLFLPASGAEKVCSKECRAYLREETQIRLGKKTLRRLRAVRMETAENTEVGQRLAASFDNSLQKGKKRGVHKKKRKGRV